MAEEGGVEVEDEDVNEESEEGITLEPVAGVRDREDTEGVEGSESLEWVEEDVVAVTVSVADVDAEALKGAAARNCQGSYSTRNERVY